jgi:hypothetical protein
MATGSKEDVSTLSSGDALLQWPERITPDEYEDLEGWLQLMLRKLKRSIVAEDDPSGDDPTRGDPQTERPLRQIRPPQ